MTNSKKISISASARLIHQLGEQLITDELVALMELVKNSYDADATLVKVKVDTKHTSKFGRGKITIEDNGHGMLPSIIENNFLRISTDFKLKNKFSLKYGRMSLGNKGLGRLSFQRLGAFVNLISNPDVNVFTEKEMLCNNDISLLQKYESFNLKINWNDFNADKELNDLKADLYFMEEGSKKGTIIEIEGLRNIEFWDFNKQDLKELIRNLYGMTNPFNSEKSKDKFKIKFYLNDKLFSNEEIDEELIKNVCFANYDFSLEKNIFKLEINYKEKMLRKIVEKKEEELISLGFIKDYSEVDYSGYKNKIIEFDLNSLLPDKEIDKNDEFYSIFSKIDLELNNGELALPGNFKGKLYYNNFKDSVDFNKLSEEEALPESIKNFNQYKDLLKRTTGFYIFRNGFRILPYGKLDWAGFDKYTKRIKYTPFGNENFSGYIDIDGNSSQKLREQTNRLGFIEDEYGKNFMKVIREILVYLINQSFRNLREDFQDKSIVDENKDMWVSKNKIIRFKKIKTTREEREESKNAIETSVKKLNNVYQRLEKQKRNNIIAIDEMLSERKKEDEKANYISVEKEFLTGAEEIKKITALLEKEIKNIDELSIKESEGLKQEKYLKEQEILEIKNILPMAGQGIIVESMTHELGRIQKKIREYSLKTLELINNLEFCQKKDAQFYQNTIIDETIYLKEQLSHLQPTYKKSNRLIENIEVKSFLSDIYLKSGTMKRKAEEKNIKIKVTGEELIVRANKGYMITIFDNLFLNSLYWLEFAEGEKVITFDISSEGSVFYHDSGIGIHNDIQHKLFEPFESKKKDGRGLGLYIVSNLLESLNAKISLTNDLKNNKRYKFLIKFEEIEMQRSLF